MSGEAGAFGDGEGGRAELEILLQREFSKSVLPPVKPPPFQAPPLKEDPLLTIV